MFKSFWTRGASVDPAQIQSAEAALIFYCNNMWELDMRSRLFAVLALGALASLSAIAQAQPPAGAQSSQQGTMMQQGGMMHGSMMQGGMMGGQMMGMHVMTVTVTALDAKTGLVDASSGNMALKLHFPSASLAGIKAGDKLSVHLGFNKL